jgi:hypothetical protein
VTPITPLLAFCKQDGRVTYFNVGMPVFVHDEADTDSFRLNDQGRPIRHRAPRWERSTVWERLAARRTIEPSLVQGMVVCKKCGDAWSRTSTRRSARKIHYYRCIGSDAWRHVGGSVCDSRPIRQDVLDQVGRRS